MSDPETASGTSSTVDGLLVLGAFVAYPVLQYVSDVALLEYVTVLGILAILLVQYRILRSLERLQADAEGVGRAADE